MAVLCEAQWQLWLLGFLALRWWGWKCSHTWRIADSPLSGSTQQSGECCDDFFVGVCLGIYSGFVKRWRLRAHALRGNCVIFMLISVGQRLLLSHQTLTSGVLGSRSSGPRSQAQIIYLQVQKTIFAGTGCVVKLPRESCCLSAWECCLC